MAKQTINNMAVFCDFENIALGVRDAKYSKFDIDKVLERLLLKGSIVVKKAYCDPRKAGCALRIAIVCLKKSRSSWSHFDSSQGKARRSSGSCPPSIPISSS